MTSMTLSSSVYPLTLSKDGRSNTPITPLLLLPVYKITHERFIINRWTNINIESLMPINK